MTSLVTFPKASPVDELLEVFRRDGACIIKDVLSAEEVKQTLEQVMLYVERTRYGADEFTGKRTRRTGALVARSESCREIVTNELILETAEKFLADYTKDNSLGKIS